MAGPSGVDAGRQSAESVLVIVFEHVVADLKDMI